MNGNDFQYARSIYSSFNAIADQMKIGVVHFRSWLAEILTTGSIIEPARYCGELAITETFHVL